MLLAKTKYAIQTALRAWFVLSIIHEKTLGRAIFLRHREVPWKLGRMGQRLLEFAMSRSRLSSRRFDMFGLQAVASNGSRKPLAAPSLHHSSVRKFRVEERHVGEEGKSPPRGGGPAGRQDLRRLGRSSARSGKHPRRPGFGIPFYSTHLCVIRRTCPKKQRQLAARSRLQTMCPPRK